MSGRKVLGLVQNYSKQTRRRECWVRALGKRWALVGSRPEVRPKWEHARDHELVPDWRGQRISGAL